MKEVEGRETMKIRINERMERVKSDCRRLRVRQVVRVLDALDKEAKMEGSQNNY